MTNANISFGRSRRSSKDTPGITHDDSLPGVPPLTRRQPLHTIWGTPNFIFAKRLQNWLFLTAIFVLCFFALLFLLLTSRLRNEDSSMLDVSRMMLIGVEALKKSPMEAIGFTTDIPMYYINLDASVQRKSVMEETFGTAGQLFRVPAFEKKNLDLYITTVLNGESKFTAEEYLKAARASSGEVSLFFSHLKAIGTAFADGASSAIILEDDMSMVLVPFWRYTPDDIVSFMKEPWDIIRLQYGVPGSDIWKLLLQWRADPHATLYKTNQFFVGAGSYLISRNGMEKILAIYINPHGHFDCLRRKHDVKCVADKLLFQGLETFLVMPPLITPRFYKASTGVRDGNDNYIAQHQEIVDSLRWVVEDFEMRVEAAAHRSPVSAKGPPTRWAVLNDVNSFYFTILRVLEWFGLATSK